MRLVYTENLHGLTLPPRHRFPVAKYGRIVETLAREHGPLLQLGAPASWDDVRLVHAPAYVERVRDGSLDEREVRRLGFPWSEALVSRSLRSVGGTLTALAWAMETGAAGHVAGGTHHAFRDRGEGFCVFNDIAVAATVARRDHGVARPAVIDLDVHQGNGTASIFADDEGVFTLSLHNAHNYPFQKERSRLDVPLADGCDDATYLRALAAALERVSDHRPDVVFYQSGVDCLAGDRLGRMALSAAGLSARDRMVFDWVRARGVPLVVTLGGGYHPAVEPSVEAHCNVYRGLVAAFA
ncbi:MAG: histone deacetylase [Polyangiaceae bacterium]